MTTAPYTTIRGIEDNYDGNQFESFGELMANFRSACEDDLYGPWNVPVWIDYNMDAQTLTLGLMLTRHGVTRQWFAPASEDELHVLEAAVLRVWAGRAEHRFARHTFNIEGYK